VIKDLARFLREQIPASGIGPSIREKSINLEHNMRKNFRLGLIIAGISLMGAAHHADATTAPVIPDASLDILQPSTPSPLQPFPYNYTSNFTNPSLQFQQEALITPDPTVATSINGPVEPFEGFGSGLLIQYYFEIVGGTDLPVPVTVDIDTGWSIDASSDAVAAVDFWLQTGNPSLFYPDAIYAQGYQCVTGDFLQDDTPNFATTEAGLGPGNSAVDQCGLGSSFASESLLSNTLYSFVMTAHSFVADSDVASLEGITEDQNASAIIDPSIYIDPDFTDAADYSVVLSPGVGDPPPPSSVPEPTSLAILGAGLAGLCLVRRRRKFA
jgi:hypothetical protein